MYKWLLILMTILCLMGCKDIRKEYHENGNISLIAEYEGNFIDGKLERFDEVGNKVAEEFYKKGKKNGKQHQFNGDGKLVKEENYEDGKREGLQIIFFDNGNKKSEAYFKGDVLNGAFADYYENRIKKEEGLYVDGKLNGILNEYYEDGSLHRAYEYDLGTRLHLMEYYPNGQLHLNQSYKNGIVDKKSIKEYDKNGDIIFEFFEKGLKDSRDGSTYSVVTIGYQTWMAENLKYITPEAHCCKGDNACEKYGLLYNWDEAMKACPSGWRLPNQKDLQKLVIYAGGEKKACKKLRADYGWLGKRGGTNDFLFSAIPHPNPYEFFSSYITHFWSSSEKPRDFDYAILLRLCDVYFEGSTSTKLDVEKKEKYESIRCIKN